MAQLPPKAPSVRTMAADNWGEEFADFSSARRGIHRRSASDSIAFLDDVTFDDDHHLLMSIFCHDASPALSSPSNPSSPSDGDDSAAVKPKAEIETADPEPEFHVSDPKRVKRILANRQSAQRSRVRKLQYISELERSVTTLQTQVSALSPRVAFLDHQRLILNVDNSALKQRIAALAQDKIFKDAHQEALKKEIERLRQVYEQQNTKCTANQNARNSDDMDD